MFCWLFYEKLFHVYSPFRLFQYSTVRTAFASITALALSLIIGPRLISRLRQYQIGQHIREEVHTQQNARHTDTQGAEE